jgi:hypothetical protein
MIVAPFAFVARTGLPAANGALPCIGSARKCIGSLQRYRSRHRPDRAKTVARTRVSPLPPPGTPPASLTGASEAVHTGPDRSPSAASNPSQPPIRCYRW